MKRKILVAFDSNSVQKIVATACKNEDAVVKKTGDGKAAFNLLDKFNPDLVVAETYLPVMSGIQLCQKIKNSNQFSSIKVLLLTDQSEYLTEKERLALRVDGILAKPFKAEDVFKKMNEVMGESEGKEVREIKIIPGTKDQASRQPGANPDEELESEEDEFESEEDEFEEEDIELMDLAIISNEVELAYFLASGQPSDSKTDTSTENIEIIPGTKDQASRQSSANPDKELESEEDEFEEEDIELMDLGIISNEIEVAYFLASGQVSDTKTDTSTEDEGSPFDQTDASPEDQASSPGAEEETMKFKPAMEENAVNGSGSATTKPESKVEHFLDGLAQSMQSKEELTKIFQKISIQEPDLDEKEITELSESVVRTIQKVVKEAAPAIVRSIIKEEITKVVKTMESDLEEMEVFEITESLIQTIQKILIIQKLIKEVTPDIVRDIIKEEIPKFKKLEEM